MEDLDRKLDKHFTIFVYPFLHHLGPQTDRHELFFLSRKWEPWFCRKTEEKSLEKALDDTYFFLPFGKKVLFPEFEKYPNTEEGRSQLRQDAEVLRRSSPEALSDRTSVFLKDRETLHLSLKSSVLRQLNSISISQQFEQDQYNEVISIEWVDLSLFPQGIGFLAIKATLNREGPKISDLISI